MENNNQRDILISVKVDNQDAIQATESLKRKFNELTQAVDKYSQIDLNNASINDLEIALTQAKNLFKELSASGLASVDDLKKVSTEINSLNNQIAKVQNIDIKVNDNIDELKGRLLDLQNIDLPNVSLDSLNFEIEKSQRLFHDIFNIKDANIDTEGMLTDLMAVMDNINGQITGVDIPVDIETNQAESETEALKRKFKDLSNIALSFDSIDFDNASIGELETHLKQANNVLKELKASGLASEQQIADMTKTVTKLKTTISGGKFEKAFQGFEGTILGAVGATQLLQSSVSVLGIESESTEKSIQKMLELMTLKDAVENISRSITAMKALTTATDGTTSSTKLLGLGFKGLGIGLLIAGVMYLVNNWNSLYATVKEFIPSIDSVGGKFKNMSAIMEGVGKAVIGFVLHPIQSAIKAFNLLKDGDWKGAGKEILSALNPIERIGNVIKDFNSGFDQGVIKQEATENIKNFNDATEKSIALLEAQGGKEKEIFALKQKMWSNEITQLKKKNKVLSDADQKRVNELTDLMQVEGVKHNKFLADAGKASADAFQQGVDEFKKSMIEINKIIADVGKSERQKEIEEIDSHYQELITKAKKYKQDISAIERAREIKRAEVNKKFDTEDAEKELEKTELKGNTELLKAKTGNEEKTVADVSRIAEAELKNLKETYDKELVLAKDNKEKLENLEAQYANDVYNINKSLADKIIAIKDKELQDAKDKVNTVTETKVLQVENEILESEKDFPDNPDQRLTDDQIKLVLDNVNRLHEAKLEQLRLNYEAERLLYADNAEKLKALDEQYKNDLLNAEKDLSEQKIGIKQDEAQKKINSDTLYFDSANSILDASKVIAEESTIFQKSLAVAQATISTYSAGNQIMADPTLIGRPWERFALMASTIASGLANVASIIKTKVNNKSGSSGNNVQAPTINVTQLQPRATQDVRVVSNPSQENKEPLRAYIVSKDISQWQEKENQAKQNSEY